MLIPTLGGLAVGILVKLFGAKAAGGGVPDVMLAVARKGGVIHKAWVLTKTITSSITLGTGGSAGPEGPIIQIGSSIGSGIGQFFKLGPKQLRIALGCGSAAGIAAMFNAPIAGAFFASEVILGEFAGQAFGAVVLSSVASTVIARSFLGEAPAFSIPHYNLVHPAELFTYAWIGVVSAVIAVGFTLAMQVTQDGFHHLKRCPSFLKPALGGLAVGAMGLARPELLGVGYEITTEALKGHLSLGVLALVLGGKFLATCFTVGSGGAGGVFAPSLVMGAVLGGAMGQIAADITPFAHSGSGAYAVVGMAAFFSASTHAPITSLLIIFELTGDYSLILPVMLGSVIAAIVSQKLLAGSIYTQPLLRQGINLREPLDVNVLRSVQVKQLTLKQPELIYKYTPFSEIYEHLVTSHHSEFFVQDEEGVLCGVISVAELRHSLHEYEDLRDVVIAADLMSPIEHYVTQEDTIDFAMRQFVCQEYDEMPVVARRDLPVPIGIIQRRDVMDAYNKEILRIDFAGSFSNRLNAVAHLGSWETIGGYVIAHVQNPAHFCGKTLEQLDLRAIYGVQVMLIEDPTQDKAHRYLFPDKNTRLELGQNMILFGTRQQIRYMTGLSVSPQPLPPDDPTLPPAKHCPVTDDE